MDRKTFDTVTKLFAGNRVSRRQTLLAGAQDASPIAPDAEHGPEMLFVQSFQSGSIVPSDAEGRYTVTLEQGLGETIYFSDRPDRIVGSTPTAAFLDGLGFSDDNPPNAAILTQSPDGSSTLAVIELFTPAYDDATHSVTYDVQVLDHWQDQADVGFSETPVDLDALGASFGTTHLFIDDCADGDIKCMRDSDRKIIGVIPSRDHDGFCYSWGAFQCLPCQPWIQVRYDAFTYWDQTCNDRFVDACSGDCEAFGV